MPGRGGTLQLRIQVQCWAGSEYWNIDNVTVSCSTIDPTISLAGPFCETDGALNLTGGTAGGTWSGTGITNAGNGTFDPGVAGVGTHTITYTVGAAPCVATDNIDIIVNNCALPCNLDNFTANVGACSPGPDNYATSGVVEFSNPPATGQLIIEDCDGNQDVFNAPFSSPQVYMISSQDPDGAACDVEAYFTDDAGCNQTINYTAPVCLCNLDNFTLNIGTCDPNNDSYSVDGIIEFTSPPSTGTLIVVVDNGTTTFDTIIDPPFSSPQNYSISNIPANGAATTITVYFSDDVGCTQSINFNAPANCVCDSHAGTFNDNITGNTSVPYELCFGDQLDIVANGDYIPSQDFNIMGTTFDPGIWLMLFTCPPTVTPPANVNTDPCYVGIASSNNGSWNIPNNIGDGSTLYYVPVTMYSMVDGVYAISINGGDWCYDMGPIYEVTYLPEITSFFTEDCLAGTATITISGGLPAVDGSNFTANNLTPATAIFNNTSAPDGGTLVISGLDGGDNWSFDITDNNGCPYTVSGGPFPPLQDPGYNYAQTTLCVADAAITPTVTGVGGGAFTVAPAGLTVNPVTGQVTPTTSTPGTYDVTYTTPGPCPDDSTITISITPLPDAGADGAMTIPCLTVTDDLFPWLNGTPDYPGVWTGPSAIPPGDPDGNFDPQTMLPGVYTYTAGTGACIASANVTVTVNGNDPGTNGALIVCESDPAASLFTELGGTPDNGGTWAGPSALTGGDVGNFNPGTMTGGTYSYTVGVGICAQIADVVVTLNPNQDASFNYTQTSWCTAEAPMTPTITGTVGGVFTVAPAGLSLNAATGEITPATSTPGSYDVTYTTAGPCPANQTVTVTINDVPIVDPVLDQTVCAGDNFTAINFTGPVAGTTFDWANSNTDIGLAVSGTGDIAAFAGGTTGGTITGAVTVTPSTVTCAGTPITFDLIVNDLDDASFDYPSGLTHCQSGTDPLVNITGVAGGAFSFATIAGGPTLDINAVTGTVTLISSDFGTYDITYSTTGACPQSSTIQMVIIDAPVADFTLGIYCANDADPLPTFINGGGGGAFTSAPAGLIIDPGTGLVDLDGSSSGTYTVTNMMNVPGCAISTFDDDITINPLPDANITGDATICPNDPMPDVTIDITAGIPNWDVTYNFDGALTTVNAATTPFVIAGAAAGTYDLVSITDGNGCTNTLAGQVTIVELPTPTVDPIPDQSLCEGDALNVPSFTGTPAGTTFDWTNTTGTDIGFGLMGAGDIGNFTGVNGTGAPIPVTVFVTPTSADGCVGVDETFVVTVNPLPVVSFTGDPLVGCEPLLVNFTNTTSPAGQNCQWDFGNGTSGTGCGVVAATYNAGTYDVSLTVTSAEGCTASVTYTDYVDVSAQPVASFTYSPLEIDVEDTEVDFTNSSLFADTYDWSFGDLSPNSLVTNPSHVYPEEPGNYTVTLIAMEAVSGCTDTAYASLNIVDVLIFYVPNVVTPDGDTYNEIFQPVFTAGYDPYDFHMIIFNRWGEIIFESFDASVGWNGHYGDGGLVQDGVYVWQIDFAETMSDKRHTHRGHVTVLK